MRCRLWSLCVRHRLIFAVQGIKIQVFPIFLKSLKFAGARCICCGRHVKMASPGRCHIVSCNRAQQTQTTMAAVPYVLREVSQIKRDK